MTLGNDSHYDNNVYVEGCSTQYAVSTATIHTIQKEKSVTRLHHLQPRQVNLHSSFCFFSHQPHLEKVYALDLAYDAKQ